MGMIGTESNGKRRGVDSEINLIPMIDLLVVTIAFLLLTQCLTSMGRMDASAQTGGPSDCMSDGPKPRKLVVDARGDKFVLTWKEGENVVHSQEIEKREVATSDGKVRQVAYPALAKALAEEWKTFGLHQDLKDPRIDPLVLRTTNELPYASLVGLLDASASVQRGPRPAFDVTFAVD